jgi:hypothetical protein
VSTVVKQNAILQAEQKEALFEVQMMIDSLGRGGNYPN